MKTCNPKETKILLLELKDWKGRIPQPDLQLAIFTTLLLDMHAKLESWTVLFKPNAKSYQLFHLANGTGQGGLRAVTLLNMPPNCKSRYFRDTLRAFNHAYRKG